MKLKKLMPAFAALCIAAGMAAVPAFADENAEASSKAKIGDTTYETLQAAITEAGNSTSKTAVTVTMTDDTTEDITIPAGANIELDLNGCTLTNLSGDTIINNGTLTITSSNDTGGKGTVINGTNGKAALFASETSTTTLENGIFKRSETSTYTNSYYTILNQGYMTIEADVTVNGVDVPASSGPSTVSNGWYTPADNTNKATATMIINGGTFTGGLNTIKNDDYGKLTINGGSFSGAKRYVLYNVSECTVKEGTFTGTGTGAVTNASGGVVKPTLNIIGGEFNGSMSLSTGTTTISGGVFSKTSATQYIVEGKCAVKNDDGKYAVVEDDGNYVASIVGVKYRKLQNAIDDIPNHSKNPVPITLLTDLTESLNVKNTKQAKLDLNGHTLTNSGANHTITVTNSKTTFTITDTSTNKTGAVDNTAHGKAALFNASGSSVTILGGTFKRGNEAGTGSGNGENSFYTIQNQGNMIIGSNSASTTSVTIENKGQHSSTVANGWQDSTNVAAGTTASLKIYAYGVTITGGINCVKNDECGTLDVRGGTFSNSSSNGAVIQNWNNAKISGGTFSGTGAAVISNGTWNDNSIGKLDITGGAFNATGNSTTILGTGDGAKSQGTIGVSGGTFNQDVTPYLAENCAVNVGDSEYTVLNTENYGTATEGSYKSAVKEGKYDQMDIFTTTLKSLSEGKATYTITVGETEYSQTVDYGTVADGDGDAVIGLIVANIPNGTAVTVTLD